MIPRGVNCARCAMHMAQQVFFTKKKKKRKKEKNQMDASSVCLITVISPIKKGGLCKSKSSFYLGAYQKNLR